MGLPESVDFGIQVHGNIGQAIRYGPDLFSHGLGDALGENRVSAHKLVELGLRLLSEGAVHVDFNEGVGGKLQNDLISSQPFGSLARTRSINFCRARKIPEVTLPTGILSLLAIAS